MSTGVVSVGQQTGIFGFKLTRDIFSDVVNELNMKDFAVAYGMTETSPVTFQVRKVFNCKVYFNFPQGFCDDDMKLKTSTIGFPSATTLK